MKKVIIILLCISIFVISSQIVFAKGIINPNDEAVSYVIEEAKKEEKNINLYSYKLTIPEISMIMQILKYEDPYAFFIGREYRFNTDKDDYIYELMPTYNLNKESLQPAFDYIDKELDFIISTIPDGLSDLEIALYLHDYIVINYKYDESLPYVYDIYNMIYGKEGVCEAYTTLYMALLEKLGYETGYAISEEKVHVWNQIKLDGEYYHVDITWDDPLPNIYVRALHRYFVLSSNGLYNHGSDIDYRYESTNAKYDNYTWHNIETPFAFANGDVYTLIDDKITKVNLENDTYESIYTIDDKWITPDGGSYWPGTFGTVTNYGDYLIFNESKTIKALNVKTNKVKTIYTFASNNNIYGVYALGDTLKYYYSSSPNDDYEIMTLSLRDLFDDSDNIISGIEISRKPYKQTYYYGETIDLTGLLLTISYSSGFKKAIDSSLVYSNVFVADSLGTKKVILSYDYEDKTYFSEFDIEIIIDEKCGDNLFWIYDNDDKTITISGYGEMYDYDDKISPWSCYANEIKGVIIGKGCTYIGKNAFSSLNNLEFIQTTVSVDSVGENAFNNNVIIKGVRGSFLEKYASDHGISFEISPAYTPGDINNDGVVNNKDIAVYIQYVSGYNVDVNENALDANGDGVIDNSDIECLVVYYSSYGGLIY